MITQLLNDEGLDTVERQLAERGAALLKTYDKIEDQLANLEAAHEEALRVALEGETDGENRTLIRTVVDRQHDRELNAKRRELLATTEENRRAILSVLDDYEAAVDVTSNLFKSPTQVLSRAHLGDPKRGQYLQQLSGAGPAELQSSADLAIATGDRALASAVLVTADRDSKRYGQFDRAKFAEQVVGAETKAMQVRLEEMKQTISAMREVDLTFGRTGKAQMTSDQKIKAGVARQRLNQKRGAA